VLKFRLGDGDKDERVVPASDVVVIPANLSHRAEALHDTVEFGIFTQHWLDKATERHGSTP